MITDISAIGTVLTTLKTATDIAKYLKDSGLSLEQAEEKLKLADLINALADARVQISEVKDLALEKERRIRELEDEKTLKNKMEYENPYYWKLEEGVKDGPFCQHCFDESSKLIRLQGNGEGYWECKVCKNDFRDSTYRTNAPRMPRSERNWKTA